MHPENEYLEKTVKRIEKDKKTYDGFIATRPALKHKKFFKEYRLGLFEKKSVIVQDLGNNSWNASFGKNPGAGISGTSIQEVLKSLLFG